MKPLIAISTFFLFIASIASGQSRGWDRTYGDTSINEYGVATVALAGGDFVLISSIEYRGSYFVLTRINADGDVLRKHSIALPQVDPVGAFATPSGIMVVGTNWPASDAPRLFVYTADAALERPGTVSIPDSSLRIDVRAACAMRNADIAFAGVDPLFTDTVIVGTIAPQGFVHVQRVGLPLANGERVWIFDARELSDGRIVIVSDISPKSLSHSYLTRPIAIFMSADRALSWTTIPTEADSLVSFNSVVELDDSSLMFAGSRFRVRNHSGGYRLVADEGIIARTSSTASHLLSQRDHRDLGSGDVNTFTDIERQSDGSIVALMISGEFQPFGLESFYFDNTPYLVRLDNAGTAIREIQVGKTGPGDGFRDLQQLPDGGYLLTGTRNRWRDQYSRNSDAALVRTRDVISRAPSVRTVPFKLDLW